MAKLVTIGDSLTQGFQSGSISKSHLSFPALAARALGVTGSGFRVPDFVGEGGLPLNLEDLLRHLEARFGPTINALELPAVPFVVGAFLDRVEDYWERGPGAGSARSGPYHHNLAVFGFEVGDADMVTERLCREAIPPSSDDWVAQLPEWPMYRAARRTLNPSLSGALQDLSQIDAAQRIAEAEGGIENLIVWLGGNNCLATTIALAVRPSVGEDLLRLPHQRTATLWRPDHFAAAYGRVARRIDAIRPAPTRVFVGTIPHVTILPVCRGVSLSQPERDAQGYYEYYTQFWVWDADFKADPSRHLHLTRAAAREIDATIDSYNATIRAEAAARGWHVIDYASVLDRLAFRRQGGRPTYAFPAGLVAALRANPATQYLVTATGDVQLDTRYVRADRAGQLTQGGLISLDGIHPTTIGYGIAAHEVLVAIGQAAGTPGLETNLDWSSIVATDRLVSSPPRNLEQLKDVLGLLSWGGFLGNIVRSATTTRG